MKIVLAVLVFVVCGTTIGSSQALNVIPTIDIRDLDDGWYKFERGFVSFDVEIINGRMVEGVVVWPDKSKYEGYLDGNNISGRGTYYWPNGIKYQGKFLNNRRQGKGSLILQDNTKWFGPWKDNKQHGKGKIFDANGKLVRKGVWENGREIKST